MSRYIDADKLKKDFENEFYYMRDDNLYLCIEALIEEAATADVAPVVRCGQCKYCTLTDEGEYNPNDIVCCYFMTDGMEENDYCSRGERREEL